MPRTRIIASAAKRLRFTPFGSAGAAFAPNTAGREAAWDRVGGGEVLGVACIGAELTQEFLDRIRRVRFAACPLGSAGAVFERNTCRCKTVTNLVRDCEVFVLA